MLSEKKLRVQRRGIWKSWLICLSVKSRTSRSPGGMGDQPFQRNCSTAWRAGMILYFTFSYLICPLSSISRFAVNIKWSIQNSLLSLQVQSNVIYTCIGRMFGYMYPMESLHLVKFSCELMNQNDLLINSNRGKGLLGRGRLVQF